ncbi:MAG: 16S rRNA (adenine(1518)-N(6)/adenine(1519)-N(6)) -dimethyltransferase RsmA [Steroidobacteraceae bacterium]
MRHAATRAPPPRRKRFGQHFLHDPAVIGRIVAALDVRPGEHLVEIGPGRGALTHELLRCGDCSFDAIEIDRDLAQRLRGEFQDYPRRELHEADALDFDFAALASRRGGRLRIIGNLPYNISTPLLFHLIGQAQAIADLHVMLQREVVARLAASPGSRDFGRLTLMVTPYLAVEKLFEVGPGAFQPPPRVWSAVVRLTVRTQPLFPVSPHYAAVVAAAFAQRRKTRRNALGDLLSRGQISACGVDPAARPETLGAAQFNALAQTLDRARG